MTCLDESFHSPPNSYTERRLSLPIVGTPRTNNATRRLAQSERKPGLRHGQPPRAPQLSRKSCSMFFGKDTKAKQITLTRFQSINSSRYNPNKPGTFLSQAFGEKREIGSGSFGTVSAVKCLQTSKSYAVKQISKTINGKYTEVHCHLKLPSHPNIVEFVDAWEEDEEVHIQLELCDRSLTDHCESKNGLTEDETWNVFVDMLNGLQHMHKNNMLHNDIKPENVFVATDGVFKIGDFGLVRDLSEDSKPHEEEGDSRYLSMEALNGNFSVHSDILIWYEHVGNWIQHPFFKKWTKTTGTSCIASKEFWRAGEMDD